MTTYSQEFLDEMKQKLVERKQQLQGDLAALKPHTELGEGNLEDEAMEIPMDEVNQDIIARMEADMEKINSAIARMEADTYGLDINTGEMIGEDRLRALPWAETAI